MNTVECMIARIYIMESSNLLNKVLTYLKNDVKIRGVSVFRAIRGYGESGSHGASLLDLSLDLPLALDFFDHKEKMTTALAHLSTFIKAEHMVFWDARMVA